MSTLWPYTMVQTCIVHLLRNSFHYARRQHWDVIAKAPNHPHRIDRGRDQRPVRGARRRLGCRYPAIVRLRDNTSTEFVPFTAFDVEIRRVTSWGTGFTPLCPS
ncbi:MULTISPECIES: transposase [Saccharothrix]|uniref:transposase n=1 Tax=Saccharothrix TaxID=2071 RepID=UPI00093B78BC|nr:transposase [Saccharothrix sp. CB00851]